MKKQFDILSTQTTVNILNSENDIAKGNHKISYYYITILWIASLVLFILILGFQKLHSQEILDYQTKIIESDNALLNSLNIKTSKYSLEIPDSSGNGASKYCKIVTGSKKISIRNSKLNDKVKNIITPKLVVYTFKNGSSAFFKGLNQGKENNKSPDKIANQLISENSWVAVHHKMNEKYGEQSDVWIWYEPKDLKKVVNQPKLGGNIIVNESESLIDINIYPNPAVDNAKISINLKADMMLKISIYDISGKVVQEVLPEFKLINNGTNDFPIDVNRFQSGMYFISIVRENSIIYSYRLIVVK